MNFNAIFAFDDLLFKPLTANVFEPRIGALYDINDNNLRLDIGASFDLFETSISEKTILRLGTDFFTYTRLRSEGRMKFPVETSDYFFGLNSSLKSNLFDEDFTARLRVAHISSHLVDGYSKNGEFWKLPEIYSREFIDLTVAYESNSLRPYLGLTSVFSTIPDNINHFIPEIGVDYSYNILDWMRLETGYDFKLGGFDNTYSGINAFQLGILFETSNNTGIELNYYYYSGLSMHGMFFTEKDKYSGIGFQVYFY